MCLEFALYARPIKRYIPTNRLQYRIWWMVTSEPFEYCVLGLIILNTVAMASKVRLFRFDVSLLKRRCYFVRISLISESLYSTAKSHVRIHLQWNT